MPETIPERKARHIDICLDESLAVETGQTHLSRIRLPHSSVPAANLGDIRLSTSFLGSDLTLPVIISSMTGGSDRGRTLNRVLARAAGERGLAFGLGSMRVMLRHPERKPDFMMRSEAPDIPILANIGAAQLGEYSAEMLAEAVKSVEADGVYVHLNPAQELFQDGGDTDFSAWETHLRRFIETAGVPVLVKETGAGIPPADGVRFLRWGAAYVDVAGAGGTDWVAVESHRNSGEGGEPDEVFLNWGYPTAELLLAYRALTRSGGEAGSLVHRRIIASGGLRSPGDFAVSLACGAHAAAAALPFIRLAAAGGLDSVHAYLDSIEAGLKQAIVLSGSDSLDSFRTARLRVPGDLRYNAQALADSGGILDPPPVGWRID